VAIEVRASESRHPLESVAHCVQPTFEMPTAVVRYGDAIRGGC